MVERAILRWRRSERPGRWEGVLACAHGRVAGAFSAAEVAGARDDADGALVAEHQRRYGCACSRDWVEIYERAADL